MTIHLVGLPHTSFDKTRFSGCAFTTKAVEIARVLKRIGRHVTVYWGGDDTPEDVEFVSLMKAGEQRMHFGEYDPAKLPSLDWSPKQLYWVNFNRRAIERVHERIRPGDIVAIMGGLTQQEIVDFFSRDFAVIEPCAGYEGIARHTHVCFESYAWMHHTYGRYGINDGRYFDAVIPGIVDPNDFFIGIDDGYALFVGRMIERKGIDVAVEIAREADLPLVMAGPGTPPKGDNIDYRGAVDPKARRELMADAHVVLMPTRYIEPYGTVHIEALLSGRHVVAPDYGVFTETLPPWMRFSTLAEATHIARRTLTIDERLELREQAMRRCSPEAVELLWDRWLDMIDSIRDGRNGWYAGTSREAS